MRHSPTHLTSFAWRRLLALFGLAGSWGVLWACGPLPERTEVVGEARGAIVGGTVTTDYPAVGQLFAGPLGGKGSFCSATLIGKKTVLTAAHCIDYGQPHHFITDANVSYEAESVLQHEAWDPNSQAFPNDLGIVILKKAPPLKPALITDRAPTVGLNLTLVGLGETTQDKGDVGVKRVTKNTLGALYVGRYSISGVGGGEGNICHGDSGGPTFATLGGHLVQVGIHSSTQIPCGTTAYDTRVDAYLAWIQAHAKGDIYSPDTTPPTVRIVSPADHATVAPSFPLAISATDTETGIAQVSLTMDGTLASTKKAAPFTFAMTQVPEGTHIFVATASDRDGNTASAQVTLTIATTPKKSFGDPCSSHDECEGHICASTEGLSYCTQACAGATATSCPHQALCVNAGGTTFICGLPQTTATTPNPQTGHPTLVGGCAIHSTDTMSPSLGLLLLLILTLIRRRQRAT